MRIKSILFAALYDTQVDGGAAKAAIDMAARFKAHLTIAIGAPLVFSPMLYPAPGVASLEVEINDSERQRIAGLVDAIRKQAQLAGVTAEGHVVQDAMFGLYGAMSDLARVSDITITSAPGDDDGARREFVEGLVAGGGGPVIILPVGSTFSGDCKRIVVGWDGGLEASRAIRHAMPLLELADVVELATVTRPTKTEKAKPLAGEVTAHLARRCRSVSEVPLVDTQGVAAALTDHAALVHADLIVMGFYGHSRLREWALGGATHDMVRQARLPVLFAT